MREVRICMLLVFFFSSRRRHTRYWRDWSSDVCSSDLTTAGPGEKGHETWEPRDAYLRGGASTWITGSYDPELDLVYWGTGNAGAWNPAKRKGDNLYVATLLAIKPKTGEIAWYYQVAPNDIWDWDSWEIILGDLRVNGQMRKVAMHMSRNGFLYVLDRTNG